MSGRNETIQAGATWLGYDARGNLSDSGSSSYSYTDENLLVIAPGIILSYDALGRLKGYGPTSDTTRFVYEGDQMASEVSSAGVILRRYVWGPGDDEPVVWYEGAGTTDRRWYHADERGSIIALSDSTGAMISINKYDEYGIPGAGNIGRFQYTGQVWISEVGLYYYKARMYSPTLGKFMQTDPVEYEDGMNWYNYAGSDPVNMKDPTGLGGAGTTTGVRVDPDIVVTWRPKHTSFVQRVTRFIGSTSRNIMNKLVDFLSNFPATGISGAISAYEVLGGGYNNAILIDPKSGKLGISLGIEVGTGVGVSARGQVLSGSQVTGSLGSMDNVFLGAGVSGNGQIGGFSFGVNHELLGSSMHDTPANRTQFGAGAGGGGLSINVNGYISGGVSFKIYNPRNEK